MTETIRYTRIGKEDIFVEPRDGQFEVELADGRHVVMSALDIAYLLSDSADSIADLPGPGTVGRLMRVNRTLFMDAGSQWISLLTLGQSTKATLPAPDGTGQLLHVTDDVHGIWWDVGQWIGIDGEQANVKEFGAVGDGLTNDTAAITNALAAAAQTHGTVMFPPGVYAPDATTFTLPDGVSIRSTGRGGLAFVFHNQSNYVNNLIAPLATGTVQQTAVFVKMVSGDRLGQGTSGNHPARIAAVLSAETGGGTGLGTGEPLRALNIVIQQNDADTLAQLVGMEMAFNNNKDHATLDMPFPNQVAFSMNSNGSKRAGIAFNVAGVGQWMEPFQIAAGAVAQGGFLFRYKGNGVDVNSLFAITAHGSVQFGFAGTTSGAPGSPILYNNLPFQGLLNNNTTPANIFLLNDLNTISIDPGQLGVVFGGGIADHIVVAPIGAGSASSPFVSGTGMFPNSQVARTYHVYVNDGAAFTIVNPTEPRTGRRLTFQIRNLSGGAMGGIIWDNAYKLSAWTNPANQYTRTIEFQYDGQFWYETSRTPADVPTF